MTMKFNPALATAALLGSHQGSVRIAQEWAIARERAEVSAAGYGISHEQLAEILAAEEARAMQSPTPFSWDRVDRAIADAAGRGNHAALYGNPRRVHDARVQAEGRIAARALWRLLVESWAIPVANWLSAKHQ